MAMTWRHLMFAIDPASRIGPRAIRKLTHLAHSFDAEVELFQCIFEWAATRKGGIGSVASDEEMRPMIDCAHDSLEVLARALRESGIRTHVTVRWDHPAHESILRQVLKSHPDLLVFQSSHHARLARLMFTHDDYKLIETVPCPLLLMKSDRAYMDACVLAAVDPVHAHDKPAELDDAIVEAARTLAAGLNGTLHICHAHMVDDEARTAYRVAAESRVKTLASSAHIREDRIHLACGDPSDLVPECARTIGASVLVMGAMSRSALQRALIGHTAERVLDAVACDVLVVKSPRSQRFTEHAAEPRAERASASSPE
jgi:universal stress protein E